MVNLTAFSPNMDPEIYIRQLRITVSAANTKDKICDGIKYTTNLMFDVSRQLEQTPYRFWYIGKWYTAREKKRSELTNLLCHAKAALKVLEIKFNSIGN